MLSVAVVAAPFLLLLLNLLPQADRIQNIYTATRVFITERERGR